MAHPTGESESDALRLDFDRRLKLEFHGSNVTSDAGLLPFPELDDALGLTEMAGAALSDGRRGKNTRHVLSGLLRQSVFGRLAGYDDVNDADRLARDPAMRWIVGGRAVHDCAASASQMGRFETEWLTSVENLVALADLSGHWIDRVHGRQPPRTIVLDMDSSVSPPTAIRRARPTTGTLPAPAIIRFSCSISSVIWNAACCVRATSIRRTVGRTCWNRSWPATEASSSAATSAPMPPSRTRRSMSSWRAKASIMRSGCLPIGFFK
jgi:hypothetical protein